MSTPQTNPLTYNAYVEQIAVLAVLKTQTVSGVVEGVDDYFNTLIPSMLNYAELRIQRDLDMLPALTSRSYTFTSGNNVLALDADDFVTIDSISVNNGTLTTPLIPASQEFLQNVYGNAATTGTPKYFAMTGGDLATGGTTSSYVMVGPYPAGNYAVSIYGVVRLPSLYLNASDPLASTAYTFISTYYPDMLVQASMIYISEFQRNFGAASNDPAMGQTFESQYQALLAGAKPEEARKKFEASAWSSSSLPTAATAGR